MPKFRVSYYQDNNYEVLEWITDRDECDEYELQVFKGSISDCEAYIRLKEGGYL